MSPNHSFLVQVVGLPVDEGVADDRVVADVEVGSLQPPNQPTLVHVDVGVGVGIGVSEGVVIVGTKVADGTIRVSVDMFSSLQPNQPGVLQVEVEVVVVVEEVVGPLVVLSSRQPHQPGVLQVSVRVLVDVAVEDMLRVVVEDSVPLLSKNSHG